MKTSHLITIAIIFVLTSFAWWFLGGTITMRTAHVRDTTTYGVHDRWGPNLVQKHPTASYKASDGDRVLLQPATSDVKVSRTTPPSRRRCTLISNYRPPKACSTRSAL
jgi:hypothetical protein